MQIFHKGDLTHETANPRQPDASALRHGLGRGVRRPERGHELCRALYHAGGKILSRRPCACTGHLPARQKGNLRPPVRNDGKAAASVRRGLRPSSVHGQHHPAVRHHPHDGRKIRLYYHHVYHPRPLPRPVRKAPREAYELGLRDPRAHGTLSSVCRWRGPLRGQLRRLADASVRGLFRVPYSLYRPRVP